MRSILEMIREPSFRENNKYKVKILSIAVIVNKFGADIATVLVEFKVDLEGRLYYC